jgi:acetate---CoA ligase (ADP-forming)
LREFFEPRSIALIGASADPLSISARPLRMLAQHGFPAERLFPVNPKYSELNGQRVYPAIADVPGPVDLALVAVPAPLVPGVVQGCAAAGVRYAVILSSGFAETGAEGLRLQQHIKEVVGRSALRVNGPNAEGFYAAGSGVCATFSPAVDPEQGFTAQPAGPVAVVSQSGGLGFALLNQGREMGIGFNAVVSTGNEVDLTWLDYVDYFLDEPSVRVVLGFIEGLRARDRLIQIGRKAAHLSKPLIVAKMGRSEPARRAALFHTGSDVGDEADNAATFEELGIVRVDDVDEMLDLAAYFSVGRLPRGRRLAVLTTSGGAGAWLADACATRGFELPETDDDLQGTIRSFIPAYGSTVNPVDITAQAVFGGGFERALGLLVHSPDFDAVAGVGSMVREDRFLSSLDDLREALDGETLPVVFYAYTRPGRAVISALSELGIPCYSSPARAARALGAALGYRAFLDEHLLEEARL